MTSELLSAIAGIVLSLGFSYVPRLKDWYSALDGTYKRAVMAGLLLLIAVAAFGLSCWDIVGEIACDKVGAVGLFEAFLFALVANQATYLISPRASGFG